MARIRSVKPEIRRSLTVSEWPREVRLAWIYLWMYLDDEGRGLDDMRLVVAELFPLDRDVTEKKMDKWLNLMATTKTSEDDVPPLCRYEVQGRRYLHAVNWQHQKINRPQPSRLPPCPIHGGDSESFRESITEQFTEPSSDDSLSDSPPSRAPADQGSGSRDQGSKDQGSGSARGTRGTRIPDDWTPSPQLIDQMRTEGIPDELARRELPRFRDYWAGVSGAKGVKADWPATWRNWIRKANDERPRAGAPPGRPPGIGNASVKAQGWLTVDDPPDHHPAIEGRTA